MKKLSLVVLFLALGSLTLAGCSTTRTDCGCLKANCCSWDFYKECDLVEGRANNCCGQCCDPCAACCGCGKKGVVVERSYAVPAAPTEDAAPDAAPADAPADAPTEEPVSDFGLPPAGR